MAKAPAKKAQKGFEETLWDTANQLRGSVESSEYKHVVLSLVFLKFISDKFEKRRQQLINEGKDAFVDMDVFYQQDNIFYLPEEARWSYIQAQYPDWSYRDDIKAALKVELILLLHKYGFPPVANDDVYKDVLEQAENFKKNQI